MESNIVITCSPGIATFLAEEVENLGFPIIKTDGKSITTSGSFTDTIILNYKLRTANRVLYRLFTFDARHPNHLYKNVTKFPWEEWISPQGYFSVDSFVKNDFIKDSRFANLRVKDAIVDRILKQSGSRPDSGPERNKTVLFLYWFEKNATIYLDTSGETLAKHGYRLASTKAPLPETVASSCLLKSKWNGDNHFINPMCGSGTLAIEAALLAAKRYPGDLRFNYGFMHQQKQEFELFNSLRANCNKIPDKLPFAIVANDKDRRAISAARQNAQKAGVEHLIDFHVGDFRKMEIPDGDGAVIINPEYGIRMGNEEDMSGHYSDIGDFLKQACKGKNAFIFTGNLVAAKKIGLKASSRTQFYNGKIECRLLEYNIYEGSQRKKD